MVQEKLNLQDPDLSIDAFLLKDIFFTKDSPIYDELNAEDIWIDDANKDFMVFVSCDVLGNDERFQDKYLQCFEKIQHAIKWSKDKIEYPSGYGIYFDEYYICVDKL